MLTKLLVLISLLPVLGLSPNPAITCFGVVQFRPDGVKQSAVYYSNGNLDRVFISSSDTHYSDGALIGPKEERDRIFELASSIYDRSTATESAAFNYDQNIDSDKRKNLVIVFIQTDHDKTKRFERAYDKEFDSPDLKKLDAFLQSLLDK
jgi:hypothetical protein